MTAGRRIAAVAIPIPAAVIALLEKHAEIVDTSAMPPSSFIRTLPSASAVLLNSTVPFGPDLVQLAPELRIVASASVGTDNIAVDALALRSIPVTNSRGTLAEAVADLAYALIILAQRRLPYAIDWVRRGDWSTMDVPFGHDLDAAVLGIVGMGQIGAAVARRAQTSGMRVLYTNRGPRNDDAMTGASFRPLATLFAEADCVLALAPLTDETRGMFDDAAFAQMKSSAVFINVGRGKLVDQTALVRALDDGRIAGAALDVLDPEPPPADHPLLHHPKVLVTPHVGSATHETRERMAMLAARNIVAALNGQPLLTPVSSGSSPT
jgi:glyoxylate reductase